MKMMRAAVLGVATLVSGAAFADPAVGTWVTPPDRKNLVSHIQIAPCGAALCGTVLRAMDRDGREVKTANVGKCLFWDLRPEGDGLYSGGTVYVPLLDVTAKASARLTARGLRVTGCKGPVCDGQVWTRLR